MSVTNGFFVNIGKIVLALLVILLMVAGVKA